MTEEKINPVSRGVGKRGNNLQHQQLTGLFEVSMEEEDRSSSGIPELDRVLGGGIVKGSITNLSLSGEQWKKSCLCIRRRIFKTD